MQIPGAARPCTASNPGVQRLTNGDLRRAARYTAYAGTRFILSLVRVLSYSQKQSAGSLPVLLAIPGPISIHCCIMFLHSVLILAYLCAWALASTRIVTYGASACETPVGTIDGPETGVCQENTLGRYSSFKLMNADPTCSGMFMDNIWARIELIEREQSLST